MRVDLSYLGRSGVSSAADGLHVSFSPNLARGKVFFDGQVENPVRYREAMSALHDVVVSDLRFKKRSGSEAYKTWLAEQKARAQDIRKQVFEQAQTEALQKGPGAPPPDLEKQFRQAHAKYWTARRAWANELSRNDPELWRALVPCDPVITVAPDVVFFEGFAKDESAYGCLLVDRNAFSGAPVESLGTTNVDYSMALYSSMQTLRSYRTTRLSVDPTGFDVKVSGREDYREEKIELPPTWLRAFGQITASMMLPSTTVTLDRGTVYSILAHLKRHREKSGPRSISFELTPGKPPRLVLEPWGIPIVANTPAWDGPRPETIKMWGRRRLFALARLLPLAEKIEVRLLGSGLPSLWTVHMGEMRFILGLSGWTKNDWSSSAALDLLAGLETPDPLLAARLATHLNRVRSAKVEELAAAMGQERGKIFAALHLLSKQGQAIYDFAHGVYRYRPILPVALSEELIGPEHPELAGAKVILASKDVHVERDEVAAGMRIVVGRAGGRTAVEVGMDNDGVIKRGHCDCSFYFTSRLRRGPCRHILALRLSALAPPRPRSFWN